MLRNATKLDGATIHATDGNIGRVVELLFEDDNWTIRYLVVNTGNWLLDRKVLISPIAITGIHRDEDAVCVGLTREQVKNSPDVDIDKPVSRQWETDNANHYGWPFYWGAVGFAGAGGSGPGLWGGGFFPGALAGLPSLGEAAIHEADSSDQIGAEDRSDSHLRSSHEIIGYGLHACDGELGNVEDFILDDENWTLRYLVIDTQNWWPGKKILLPPQWVSGINGTEQMVMTELNVETVRGAPDWNPNYTLARDFEERLYAYYGRTGYWQSESADGRGC